MTSNTLNWNQIHDPDGNLLSETVEGRGLWASDEEIPADGTTTTWVGYSGPANDMPDSVDFMVNGGANAVATQKPEEHPDLAYAEFELSAAEPRIITIEAMGEMIEVEAI